MYDLLHRGRLGNTSPGFDTLPEILKYLEEHPGKLCAIRTRRGPRGPFLPYLDAAAVTAETKQLTATGFRPDELQYSVMMPDHKCLMQGFAVRSDEYITLDATLTPHKNMREAQPLFKKYSGITAVLLIKERMDPESWEWFNTLLDDFPDHVVEFSIYSTGVGTLGLNTIFWEVRLY
jgi:hypothetical protein